MNSTEGHPARAVDQGARMHTNLFNGGATQDEVYEALQRDAKRDSKSIQIMDLLIVVAVIYLARDLPTWDFVAVLVIAFVAGQRLNYFIDQSNRNFFMHWLDWQQSDARDNWTGSRGYDRYDQSDR